MRDRIGVRNRVGYPFLRVCGDLINALALRLDSKPPTILYTYIYTYISEELAIWHALHGPRLESNKVIYSAK